MRRTICLNISMLVVFRYFSHQKMSSNETSWNLIRMGFAGSLNLYCLVGKYFTVYWTHGAQFENLLHWGLVKNDLVSFHPNWDVSEGEIMIPAQRTEPGTAPGKWVPWLCSGVCRGTDRSLFGNSRKLIWVPFPTFTDFSLSSAAKGSWSPRASLQPLKLAE